MDNKVPTCRAQGAILNVTVINHNRKEYIYIYIYTHTHTHTYIYTHTYIMASLCCTTEINTTL